MTGSLPRYGGRPSRLCALALLLLLVLPASVASAHGPVQVGAPHGAHPAVVPVSLPHAGPTARSTHEASSPLASPVPPLSMAALRARLPPLALRALPTSSFPPGPGVWEPVGSPASRTGSTLAYDPDLGKSIAFGGWDFYSGIEGDTWSFDASTGTWSELPTFSAPPPRAFAGMAYDPTDHLLVLFGGFSPLGRALSDTWGLTSHGTWVNLTAVPVNAFNTPTPRLWPAMATSYSGGVVVFGGWANVRGIFTNYGDTWSYTNATGWVRLCGQGSCGATVPSAVYAASMAYDPSAGDDVFFGGANGFTFTNETWVLNATGWYNLSFGLSPTPPARGFAQMTVDGSQVALLDGETLNGLYSHDLTDLWFFDPAAATPTWSGGVPPVVGGAYGQAATDGGTGAVLLWGVDNYSGISSTVWSYGGTSWTGDFPASGALPSPDRVVTAYDARDGYVVGFGPGINFLFPTTWKFEHGVWTNITPATITASNSPCSRFSEAMAYDAADGEVVLYGGEQFGPGHYLPDTWTFQAGVWTNLSGASGPAAVAGPTLAPSYPGGPLLLFGGLDYSGNYYSVTWSFAAGSWTLVAPAVSPTPRELAASTYDRSLHGMVIYGGYGIGSTLLDDTWRYDATNTTWVPVCQPTCTSSGGVVYPAITYDPLDNLTLLFGGFTGGSFALSGGSWSNYVDPTTPLPRFLSSLTWDGNPADGYAVLYGGLGPGFVPFYDTWSFTPDIVLGAPVLNRTVLDAVEQNVTISAPVAGGGTGPVTESWENLPNGCAGGTGTNLSCTPTGPGNFSIFNLAASPNGIPTQTGSPVFLQVDPALTLASVPQANRTSLDVGGAVTVWANATGGSGAYLDRWHGLSGVLCRTSFEEANCTFSSPGYYNVSLTVTDSNGVTLSTGVLALHVYSGLTVSVPVASPDPVLVGSPVTLVATAIGGEGPLTVFWAGLPAGCSSSVSLTLTCTPTSAGSFGVSVRVVDALGARAGSSNATLTVLAPAPSLSVSATASPSGGGAPLLVRLNASLTGGAPPIAIAWTFGDGYRGSGTSTVHTFDAPGTYTASVWANDSRGTSAEATLKISVGPPVLDASLSLSPAQIAVGQVLHGYVQVSGGVAPYQYVWSGLPAGCSAPSGPNVSCVPTGSGNFTVSVKVVDASGATGTASAALAVRSVVAAPGGSAALAAYPVWQLELLGALTLAGIVLSLLSVVVRRDRRPPSPGPVPSTSESRSGATPGAAAASAVPPPEAEAKVETAGPAPPETSKP